MSATIVVVVLALLGVVFTGVHLIRTAFRRTPMARSAEETTDVPPAQTVVGGERRRLEPAFGESIITVSSRRITLGIFLLVGGSCGLLYAYDAMRLANHAGH